MGAVVCNSACIVAESKKKKTYNYLCMRMFKDTCSCICAHVPFLDIPSGVSPGGLCPDGRGLALVGRGGGGVRSSWPVGRGSNGSRNRPCSAAPGSLIMVSAVNVFGVRE